jgi:hypothetical protein
MQVMPIADRDRARAHGPSRHRRQRLLRPVRVRAQEIAAAGATDAAIGSAAPRCSSDVANDSASRRRSRLSRVAERQRAQGSSWRWRCSAAPATRCASRMIGKGTGKRGSGESARELRANASMDRSPTCDAASRASNSQTRHDASAVPLARASCSSATRTTNIGKRSPMDGLTSAPPGAPLVIDGRHPIVGDGSAPSLTRAAQPRGSCATTWADGLACRMLARSPCRANTHEARA